MFILLIPKNFPEIDKDSTVRHEICCFLYSKAAVCRLAKIDLHFKVAFDSRKLMKRLLIL